MGCCCLSTLPSLGEKKGAVLEQESLPLPKGCACCVVILRSSQHLCLKRLMENIEQDPRRFINFKNTQRVAIACGAHVPRRQLSFDTCSPQVSSWRSSWTPTARCLSSKALLLCDPVSAHWGPSAGTRTDSARRPRTKLLLHHHDWAHYSMADPAEVAVAVVAVAVVAVASPAASAVRWNDLACLGCWG